MKTITIGEKTWTADYAGIGYLGYVKAQIHDGRTLGAVAPELEGAEQVILTEDGEQTGLFEGYTRLMRIERVDDTAVCFLLARPEEDEDGGI